MSEFFNIDIGKCFLRIAQKILTKDKTVKFDYGEIELFMTQMPQSQKSSDKLEENIFTYTLDKRLVSFFFLFFFFV